MKTVLREIPWVLTVVLGSAGWCAFPQTRSAEPASAVLWSALDGSGQPLLASAEERQKILDALPAQAPATPRRPRHLLIFDSNVGYGGHPSARHAAQAFAWMGEKTGAYRTTIGRDPAVFKPGSLEQFDAVFFDNTVGNLFTDPELRENLVRFVYRGGGLLGVHGTSVAFTVWPGAKEDWPEFGSMIGARGANHRDSTERVWVAVEDPAHPVTRMFGPEGFEYRDEFFRVHEPYSRERVRVLLRIDNEKTGADGGAPRGQVMRPDNDYALAWARNYGRGRTFYCTIAHNPYVFWDARMLKFYLAAIQFALGDLPAPTTPSARLTPEVRGDEAAHRRLALDACDTGASTLFAAIDQAAARHRLYLCAGSRLRVSEEIPKPLDAGLTPDELRQVRLKLDAAGVRLLGWCRPELPSDAAARQLAFAFARDLGVEVVQVGSPPASLETLDTEAEANDLRVALGHRPGDGVRAYAQPRRFADLCRGRSARIGAAADLVSAWLRAGTKPAELVRVVGNRCVAVPGATEAAHAGDTDLFAELRGQGHTPALVVAAP